MCLIGLTLAAKHTLAIIQIPKSGSVSVSSERIRSLYSPGFRSTSHLLLVGSAPFTAQVESSVKDD